MKHDLKTIAANMAHDARNNQSAEIGSGIFGPEELREAAIALQNYGKLVEALQQIKKIGGVTSEAAIASNALWAAEQAFEPAAKKPRPA